MSPPPPERAPSPQPSPSLRRLPPPSPAATESSAKPPAPGYSLAPESRCTATSRSEAVRRCQTPSPAPPPPAPPTLERPQRSALRPAPTTRPRRPSYRSTLSRQQAPEHKRIDSCSSRQCLREVIQYVVHRPPQDSRIDRQRHFILPPPLDRQHD